MQMPTYPSVVTITEKPGQFDCGPVTADGCSDLQDAQPTIMLNVEETAAINQQDMEHELGHVFDNREMTDTDRYRFMQIMGLEAAAGAWWYQFPAWGGSGSAGEWFAEAYRLCSDYGVNVAQDVGPTFYNWERYGFRGAEHPEQLAQVCDLIVSIGQRQGLTIPAQRTYVKAAEPARGSGTIQRAEHEIRSEWATKARTKRRRTQLSSR